MLQADAVAAGSRAPTPPQTSHGHRASTPSRRLSSCEVQTPQHAPGASCSHSSPQLADQQQLQQHAGEGPDLSERHGQRQLQESEAQSASGIGQVPLLAAAAAQQQQQQGVGEASSSVNSCSRAARVTAEGLPGGRNPASSTAGQLQLSTSSRTRAAANTAGGVLGAPAVAGAAGCTAPEDARQAGPFFVQVASFRRAQQVSSSIDTYDAGCAALPDSAAAAGTAAGAALGMEEYAAQVAAYRAAGLADPSALGGVVLGADGSLRLMQDQAGAGHPQQQQQVSKADGWFRRLQKVRARDAAAAAAAGRRGTWEAAPVGAAYAGSTSVPPGWQEGGGQFGQRSSGAQLAEQQLPAQYGLGADSSKLTGTAADGSSGGLGPVGLWGRRASVHDAWLHVDGRSTTALPWQALAAIAAASDGGASSSGVAPGALQGGGAAAAAAAAGSGLAQLSVRGRQLLVRMMWLKSAAGVVRGGGGDAGFLEGRLVRLLQQNTAPAGLELLLWSVEDEQQQQQIQAQQHARQQEQHRQAWGGAACAAPTAAAAADGYGAPRNVSLVGGIGSAPVWRQISTPERVLEPYLQLHGPLPQASSSSSGAVPLPRKGGASTGLGAWAPGGLGRLHGEHLPLLPAARCAPLTGPRCSTQQQQLPPGEALVLAQQLGLGSQVQPQGQQQQQHRRWHCTVDDLALRAMHEQQKQKQRFAATAASSELQPIWVQRLQHPCVILRRTTAEVHAPCSSTPQWTGPVYGGMLQGTLLGQGTAQQAGSALPTSTAGAAGTAGLWQQQQHNSSAAVAVFSSQPGLLLAVNGEGGLALPAHRQSSLQVPPLLLQGQCAGQEPLAQRQRQTPADPSSQLWLIPELQRLQPTNIAGASQAPVSFVNTKPQPRCHTRQQQQRQQPLHDAFCAEQQQQFAVCGTSGDGVRSLQGVGLAGAPASSSWSQSSHPSQWDSRCGRPRQHRQQLLPQLPAGSLRPRQHQQQLLLSADAVPWAGIKPARRLSSSDPGSTALRQAVAGARAMVAGAVLPPAVGSHSGSDHVAVVELPQLAVLRVADAVQ